MRSTLIVLTLFFSLVTLGSPPSFMYYDGTLKDNNGYFITNTDIEFTVEIYPSSDPSCILYSETHLVNFTDDDEGAFSLKVGGGTNISGNAFIATFTNNESLNCLNSGAFAGSAGESRFMKITLHENPGAPGVAMSPDIELGSTPNALIAEKANDSQTLQGLQPSSFLQPKVGTDLNQNNLESVFATGNFSKLQTLIGGSNSVDGTSIVDGSISDNDIADVDASKIDASGICTSGEFLTWDGSALDCGAPSGAGDITDVTAGTGLTGGGTTGGVTLNVQTGTAANDIVQLDGSARLPAVDGSALTSLDASNIDAGTLNAARLPTINPNKLTSFPANAALFLDGNGGWSTPTVSSLADNNFVILDGDAENNGVGGIDFQLGGNTEMFLNQDGQFSIGYTTPPADALFSIAGDNKDSYQFSNSATGASDIVMLRSRGTMGGESSVNSTDTLGSLSFKGHDGSSYQSSAEVVSKIDGTPGASIMPSSLEFRTTTGNTPTTRMIIKPNGNIGIGTNVPGETLEINGTTKSDNLIVTQDLNYSPGGAACGDGELLSWSSSNTRFECITPGGGGDFLADGSIPMAGDLDINPSFALNTEAINLTQDFNYTPAGIACTNGQVLEWNSTNGRFECGSNPGDFRSDGSIPMAGDLDINPSFALNTEAINLTQDFNYTPAGIACTNGQVLEWNSTNGRFECGSNPGDFRSDGSIPMAGDLDINPSFALNTEAINLTQDFNYTPSGAACLAGQVLEWNSTNGRFECGGNPGDFRSDGSIPMSGDLDINPSFALNTEAINLTQDFNYTPSGAACLAGQVLEWNSTNGRFECGGNPGDFRSDGSIPMAGDLDINPSFALNTETVNLTQDFNYTPAGAACLAGQILEWNSTNGRFECGTIPSGGTFDVGGVSLPSSHIVDGSNGTTYRYHINSGTGIFTLNAPTSLTIGESYKLVLENVSGNNVQVDIDAAYNMSGAPNTLYLPDDFYATFEFVATSPTDMRLVDTNLVNDNFLVEDAAFGGGNFVLDGGEGRTFIIKQTSGTTLNLDPPVNIKEGEHYIVILENATGGNTVNVGFDASFQDFDGGTFSGGPIPDGTHKSLIFVGLGSNNLRLATENDEDNGAPEVSNEEIANAAHNVILGGTQIEERYLNNVMVHNFASNQYVNSITGGEHIQSTKSGVIEAGVSNQTWNAPGNNIDFNKHGDFNFTTPNTLTYDSDSNGATNAGSAMWTQNLPDNFIIEFTIGSNSSASPSYGIINGTTCSPMQARCGTTPPDGSINITPNGELRIAAGSAWPGPADATIPNVNLGSTIRIEHDSAGTELNFFVDGQFAHNENIGSFGGGSYRFYASQDSNPAAAEVFEVNNLRMVSSLATSVDVSSNNLDVFHTDIVDAHILVFFYDPEMNVEPDDFSGDLEEPAAPGAKTVAFDNFIFRYSKNIRYITGHATMDNAGGNGNLKYNFTLNQSGNPSGTKEIKILAVGVQAHE